MANRTVVRWYGDEEPLSAETGDFWLLKNGTVRIRRNSGVWSTLFSGSLFPASGHSLISGHKFAELGKGSTGRYGDWENFVSNPNQGVFFGSSIWRASNNTLYIVVPANDVAPSARTANFAQDTIPSYAASTPIQRENNVYFAQDDGTITYIVGPETYIDPAYVFASG